MRLTSKRCSGLLATAALSVRCATAVAPRAADVGPPLRAERRPPGLPPVRTERLPDPSRSGRTEDELLVLRSPAPTELARAAVRDFLRATVDEANERLDVLLGAQASVDTAGGRQSARAFWQLRFAQLDYTELKGQLLFREADVQTFRAEDLARLPPNRRIPLELGAEELAVRVPIRISWTGRTRLFGDEMLFRLQPSGSGYRIAEIAEDFRLP